MKLALLALLSLSSAAAFTVPTPRSSLVTRLDSAATDEAATTSAYSGKHISAVTAGRQTIYTSEQIDELLPHRYPFALVDKVVEFEAGKRAVGIKSVTKVSDIDEYTCVHAKMKGKRHERWDALSGVIDIGKAAWIVQLV